MKTIFNQNHYGFEIDEEGIVLKIEEKWTSKKFKY